MDCIGSGNNKLDRAQETIMRGCTFSMNDYFTFGADEIKYFLLDPTNCLCRHIIVTNLVFDATVGPIRLEYFANTQASNNGTQYQLFNRNIDSIRTANTIIRLNPTISNEGIRIAGRCVVATGANPITGTPAIDSDDKYLKLNKLIKYLIKATNENGAGAKMQLDFTICEDN